jgi:hypothetical protein
MVICRPSLALTRQLVDLLAAFIVGKRLGINSLGSKLQKHKIADFVRFLGSRILGLS